MRNSLSLFFIFILTLVLITFQTNLLWADNPEEKKIPSFTFENVVNEAKSLAGAPFESIHGQVPDFLLLPKLTYDQWRDIRFRPEKSLWRNEGLSFEIQFFHLGLFYDLPVKINVIDGSNIEKIKYSSEMFNYNRTQLPQNLSDNLGFAGFRIHYPIKTPEYKDEVAVFLGASYLRSLGKNHSYGLSARGLAIDTATSRGEEFPYFREFWLLKPKAEDQHIVIYALLDSPSTAGAYEYHITPGEETIMEVRSVLIQRHRVTSLGIAPLTSMFLYGENQNCLYPNDFRPEVHDSDGLMISFGTGEWLWRPLMATGEQVLVNSFSTENLKSFGLLQRDTNFDHYQDLEAHYHARPSATITPRGDWGPGEIRLIQIPSTQESDDNIVAFWVPRTQPKAQVPTNYDYTLHWGTTKSENSPQGQVISTRQVESPNNNSLLFVVDYNGSSLKDLAHDAHVIAQITVPESVKIIEQQVLKNTETGGFRLVFQISPKSEGTLAKLLGTSKKPLAELRAFLTYEGEVLTETWSYGAVFR